MRTQFIIFARPRVGTHMLRTGMNQHPDIRCSNEFLNVYMMLPQQFACSTLAETVNLLRQRYPHKLNGYVLHDDQYCYPERRTIPVAQAEWDAIPANTKIIRLNRRNELARLISECRARISDEWQRSHKKLNGEDDLPFHLDFDDMMKWHIVHEVAQEAQQEYVKRFHHVLHVWYEDLLTHWNSQLAGVFKFLGVQNMFVQPTTTRMGLPLKQMISNYDEIQERCRGTNMEQYFTGP